VRSSDLILPITQGTEITNAGVPISKTSIHAYGPGLEKGEQYLPLSFTIDAKKTLAAGVKIPASDITTTATSPTGSAISIYRI